LLADTGRAIPFIDRVVQYVVRDSSTQWLMFIAGQLESSGISRDNWDAVITPDRKLTKDLADRQICLYSTPTMDTFYIGFNMDDPVVGKNRKLRQAMSCAFNSQDWVRFYNYRVVRARGPIPPGVAGYEDKLSPYAFDVEKARRLLTEAGYPEGRDPATGRRLQLALELGSANDPEMRQAVELFAAFMDRIGIVIKPSYNNWPTYLEKLERRQAQMFSLGWVADYPDAENFLQLFYGPNSSPGPNHTNYANPEFDRLYEQIRVMQDGPERSALYRKMADIVIEDCPWLFEHHPLAYGLYHHWLKNYKPHDFPYGMAKYYKIDTTAREQWKREFGRKR
jgi:ABC-type transport system substrate-binding protein